jgi:hypothetical protein
MPAKAKPKAIPTVAAPTAAPITFTSFALHSHFHGDRVAVLTVEQRRILSAPACQLEGEKDAIHRALLERRNAYCARCLSDGSPAVHPAGLDPDVTEDEPFRSLDRGRGIADHCPFHYYRGDVRRVAAQR